MRISIFLISLYVLYKAIPYGIFEIKNNDNKSGGTVSIIIAVIATVFVNIVLFYRS